jgi:hypothetical protein
VPIFDGVFLYFSGHFWQKTNAKLLAKILTETAPLKFLSLQEPFLIYDAFWQAKINYFCNNLKHSYQLFRLLVFVYDYPSYSFAS